MGIAYSAFLSEMAHRSISFFIENLSKDAAPMPIDENLNRKLLRVRVIIEEAEGRQIRNQAMLEQLTILRKSMYRGYYVLDTFKYRDYKEDDDGVSHSFALSKFSPAKRLRLLRGSSPIEKELLKVLGSLEITITDLSEFVMFLKACPPLYRPLYSTYLVLENCMFGRHVEMEQTINFLMQEEALGTANLDVLPIVGPAKAGKSTLIEHVCNDEKVRTAFSRILLLTEDNLNRRPTSIRDYGSVKYQNHVTDGRERVLVIIELDADIDEVTWTRLCSAYRRYPANGTKIIICSRSDRIARFGTTGAVRVEFLSKEAYWYFFKSLAFGSMNPIEEPKLASMAMQMAVSLNGSFIAGNIIASMLRANYSANFWRMTLSCVEEVRQRYPFMLGAHPPIPWEKTKAYVPRINGSNEYCSIYNDYQISSAQGDPQMITFQEILSGSVVPSGKFDVLAWRSSIPPYYSYMFSCEIQKHQNGVFRKRGR